MNGVFESNLREVHRIFGAKIKFLNLYRGERIDWSLFPNIERVISVRVYEGPFISQFELRKLKQLVVGIDEGEEHLLQPFIDNFPTLTHLTLVFSTEDGNAIYNPLKNILNLKHLIHFDIQSEGKSKEIVCRLLKQMANNCKNLKSFGCPFVINNKNSNIRQFFSILKAFPALKRLDLLLFLDRNGDDCDIDVNQLFSFELFKGFENITHLSLEFGSQLILKKWTLIEIDINLPKLQYLEINNNLTQLQKE